MDDAARARLRNTARLVHLIAQAILALSLLGLVAYSLLIGSAAPEVYTQRQFSRASGALPDAFNSFDRARAIGLAAIVPPTAPAPLTEWSASIARYMGHPVAVFAQRGDAVVWASRPEALTAAADRLERAMDPTSGQPLPSATDTLGTTHLVHSGFVLDTVLYHVQMIRVPGELRRWGVVYPFFEGWRTFLARLDEAELAVELEPAAENTKHIVQIAPPPTDGITTQPGLQAFLRGEEIFRSPGLDTTAESHTQSLQELTLIYYLSGEDRAYLSFMGTRTVPIRALLLLAVMIVLFLNWRWIKRLTA